MKVLLVDDETPLMEEWRSALMSGQLNSLALEVDLVDDVAGLIRELESRRLSNRGDGGAREDHEIDTADVVVLDYDLGQAGHALTGRRLAYLARSFSRAGAIVLMNEHGDNTFDLTLDSDFDCFADVEIGAAHLGSESLWVGAPSEFRPWRWPVLAHEIEALRACEGLVRSSPDLLVIETLGLLPIIDRIPTHVSDMLLEGLAAEATLDQVTLGHLVEQTIEPDGRETAFVQRKDRLTTDDAFVAVAARLRRWLNRVVAPSQDLVVDAPHLVSRFPSLLAGSHESVEAWNSTTDLGDPSISMNTETIESHRLQAGSWTDRPRWLWPSLQKDRGIVEVGDPFAERPTGDFVFCEDSARFALAADARSFASDLRAPFSRRYVELAASADYRPRSRLT